MHDNSFLELLRIDGLSDYREVWELQKSKQAELIDGKGKEIMLIAQHRPVFTLGFHGNEANMRLDDAQLRERQVELIRIERGGDITFHGPGQIVIYPIISLWKRNYGVKEYVARLEKAVAHTCNSFGVATFTDEDAPGVWCGDMLFPKKICAIGVKVSRGVTMHGLALNVTTDLRWFQSINPCGFGPNSVTSLEKELGAENCPSINDVAETLVSHIKEYL